MICQFGSVVVLMVLCSSAQLVHAQDCLQGAEGTSTQIPFDDQGAAATPLPTGSQAIVASYQFQCCGEVREWGARVQPGGLGHRDGVYTAHFQVWRPSPTSGGGGGNCYSLVGENRFPGVTLGDDRLLSETPQPTNVISVRPGDVPGYFVTSTTDGSNDGIQLDPSFPNDVVYYADLDAPLTMGTASVGPGGVLSLSTNAAPIISVNIISSSSCPPLSPPIMMTSSSSLTTPQPSPPPQTLSSAPETLPPTTPTDPPTMPPTIPDPPTPPEDPNPEQSTMTTITIVALSNTQTTTALGVNNGPNFLPTLIGVVVTIAILTGSLLTLLVGITIIRKKIIYKSSLRSSRDINMQGNDAYNSSATSLMATDKPCDVTTDVNPAYSCRDGVRTSPHLLTRENQQQEVELTQNQAYVATDIPVEPNQCYAFSRDQLFVSVEEKTNTHSSQQQDYDYVIP